jgi:hypothetical protein
MNAPRKVINFAWTQVAPSAFECHHNGVKLRIEGRSDKWTFWIRHPKRGMIQDGVSYPSHHEAANAAENAAIDSLTAHTA